MGSLPTIDGPAKKAARGSPRIVMQTLFPTSPTFDFAPRCGVFRTVCPTSHARRLRDLHRELQACQRRLGTDAEAPDDLDRARSIAHEINNTMQVAYLLAMVDDPDFDRAPLRAA